MKAFITGATGFIGSQTALSCLNAGWDVVALIRPDSDTSRIANLLPSVQQVAGTMDDVDGFMSEVQDARPDVCLHHAWYAVPGLYPHAIENVGSLHATLDLVSKLPDAGCGHFVGVGTCFEYDFDGGWLREDSPAKPATLYAAMKNATAVALPKLAEKVGIKWSWARPFYQYGPHEDTRRLVSSVIRALLRGETVDTTEGTQVRDFLHVADVGSAIHAIASKGLEGPVNIGSGQPVTVRQVIEAIGVHTGRLDLVNFGARPLNPTDPPFVVANATRLRTEGAWRPQFNLNDGIADTVAWWQAQS